MAYSHLNSKGTKYFLHSQIATLKGGREQRIYYFGKVAKEFAIDELPADRIIIENPRTGLPVLKKNPAFSAA